MERLNRIKKSEKNDIRNSMQCERRSYGVWGQAMKIIGAGYGRTGTVSLQGGLEVLGFPCIHMADLMGDLPRLRAWHDFATGQSEMDWKKLFHGYEATVDWPGCLFYRELMEVFPEALVVLTIRDPEQWFNSWERMWKTIHRFRAFGFVPRLKMYHEVANHFVVDGLFGGQLDREAHIAIYEQHIEDVKHNVPADRLLVYSVQEGWEPLCSFLGCDQPTNKPFPHLNEGTSKIVWKFTKHAVLDFIPGARRGNAACRR